jgi:hypothetical protein
MFTRFIVILSRKERKEALSTISDFPIINVEERSLCPLLHEVNI